jgi:hypothetical protein
MLILGLSKRSGRTPAILRVVILGTLLQGIASAQTSPTPLVCILSNGVATGFFGGVDVMGSFTVDGANNTSSIGVSGASNSVYQFSYVFTGPLNGAGYTQVSVMPPTPCVLLGCVPSGPNHAGLAVSLQDNTAGLFFEDSGEVFTGVANLSCSTGNAPPSPPITFCGVGATLMGNGGPTITGVAVPAAGVPSLSAAAGSCGYNYLGFNWQQFVTNAPCPTYLVPAVPGSVASNLCPARPGYPYTVGAGPEGGNTPALSDPPPGGYTTPALAGGGFYTAYPFYYPIAQATIPGLDLPAELENGVPFDPGPINIGDTQLLFHDSPTEPCLDPPNAAALMMCGGQPDAAGSDMEFTTALVGINPDGSAGPALFSWTWKSNWNGTDGGVFGVAQFTAFFPPDPGSGTGYVTITSINGVPVPPIIPPTQVATTASGLAYSRVTKTFDGTVTITNISGNTITTPTSFQLVLNSLPAGVRLANSMGTFNQCPFITIPALLSMLPGQSVSIAVQFSNPSDAAINFTPEFYAGSFN